MSSSIHSASPSLALPERAGWLERACRRAVLAKFEKLERGSLTLVEGDETQLFEGRQSGPSVTIHVAQPSFWPQVAFRGTVGAAESYMEAGWSASDLTGLVRLMVLNREVLEDMERGLARLAMPFLRAYHARRSNTVRGAQKNIAAHYDLGNDFFALFLDPTMMYSSAYFESEEQTLEEAQVARVDRICRKLDLGPNDHVLEIGTGWGYFALHAAGRYGCRVTTTTISKEQHALASARIREAGLEDRVTVLLRDYRDLEGQYDKIVSIEMIEAVGQQFYKGFFEKCASLLKPEGRALLQAIVIRDDLFESAKNAVDFIQRYIFPGSCIPSVAALTGAASEGSDLRLTHLEDFPQHYARTLAEWRHAFNARRDEVGAMGFDESFQRMWEFYLCYCEGGVAERQISVTHLIFSKPLDRSVTTS